MAVERKHTPEFALRVSWCCDLLNRCRHNSERVRLTCEQFNVGRRQACRYLAAARKRYLAVTKIPREKHMAAAINFYEQILADPEETTKNRMAARRYLDDILGLKAPLKHEIKMDNPAVDGLKAQAVLSDPDAVEAACQLDEILASRNGHVNH